MTTQTATILTQGGTLFTLDVVLDESHTRELAPTSNPIESGAAIADHAILKPAVLTLTGIIVDINPTLTPFSTLAEEAHISDPDFIDSVPVPGSLKSLTHQTVNYINRSIDLVAASASSLTGGAAGQRALAPWLTTLYPDSVLDLSNSEQRIKDSYSQLFSIQKSGLPVTVTTSSATYFNMLITSIGVDINPSKSGGAQFTLKLQEVFIVNTQYTSTSASPAMSVTGTTGGRTTAQTARSYNAGEVSLTPVSAASLQVKGDPL